MLDTVTVKVSVLLLYRGLFGSQKELRLALWAIEAFVLAYSLVEILVVIFQCRSVKAAWDMSLQSSYCINLAQGALIVGIVNVVTDLLTLVLPVHVVWRLQRNEGENPNRRHLPLGEFVSALPVAIREVSSLRKSYSPSWLIRYSVCIGSVHRCTTVHVLGNKGATCKKSPSTPELRCKLLFRGYWPLSRTPLG